MRRRDVMKLNEKKGKGARIVFSFRFSALFLFVGAPLLVRRVRGPAAVAGGPPSAAARAACAVVGWGWVVGTGCGRPRVCGNPGWPSGRG